MSRAARSLGAFVLVASLAACGGGDPPASEPVAAEEHAGGEADFAASRIGTDARTTVDEPASTDASATGPSRDLADYAARTMAIVRRHWTIPAALAAQDTMRLEASIEITIDETTRRATGFHILRESGNAELDASVMRGLSALVEANETMPEPPVGLDDRASVRLRLTNHR